MTGVYIHIPFCKQKCNYCDFCSYPSKLSEAYEYCKAVIREAETFKEHNICADTVYFGGGTPSLLDVSDLHCVLEAIHKNFNISPNAEITLEANPGTITKDKAKEYKAMGFNRVSLGVQSFLDTELKRLGRIHSAYDTQKSFEILSDAGFSNISLDLMYAIPGQNMDTLGTSLLGVLNLNPTHISCYGLKIEESTPFYSMLQKGIISEKDDDEYADMYELIREKLESAGYAQYELSNFSKKGCESRHNTKYWTGEDYIGLGAAAASKLALRRYTHTRCLEDYMLSFENEEEYVLTKDEAMSEYMFLSLRQTLAGASKEEFKKKFDCNIEDVFPASVSKHLKNGLLKDLGDRYVLAPGAYYISNYVLSDFV